MKRILLVLISILSIAVNAQETPRTGFSSPFDFSLFLSGNFGEIRANHFHGGIDIKTQGVSGKHLKSLADGYISRIQITHGSGYVLHVTYNNGFTTINRHLSGFVGKVAQRAKREQFEKESWQVDIIPEPNEYPVKKGDLIAYAGNTGYSFGPHLHLDVIENETGDYIDPLPFFKNKIRDTTAPKAQGYMIFPQRGKGVVEGSQKAQQFTINTKPIVAWGTIGAAIRAFDYMDGTSNNYGVHTVTLEVDNQLIFKSIVDRFSGNENRMINSWTYNRYMKSFIEPGNTLRMLTSHNDERGLITIDEERDYNFVYTLTDLYGNSSKYRFTVVGKKQKIDPIAVRDKYHMKWNRFNYLQEPGFDLFLPKGVLYDDAYLDMKITPSSDFASHVYRLTTESIPLHTWATLRIGLRSDVANDTTKYYVAGINSRGKTYPIGGSYNNGYMDAKVREIGTFTVAVDTIPPIVNVLNKAGWSKGTIRFKVKDEESGINTYKGTIDGQFVPFGLQIMSNEVIYSLDPTLIKKGKQHEVEFYVVDNCNNKTIIKETFYW
ncbi:MAG: M23 family metallopeptidase [Bacteroides sp.]|nr:M23 family metallopeptidase [Bacteroides sp.]MDD4720464.1 M23 family metallopeptidase [Bacteroides sp.]NLI64181.1 M23 family metallopeptidase [Bacteroidales bacterium]